MYRGRTIIALLVSFIAVPVGLWAALVAVLSLMQQALAGFLAVGSASWTQALNPEIWLGRQNVGGTTSFLDSMIGGPGAPGGTVSRYVVFVVGAMLAAGCYAIVVALWDWASGPGVSIR
jgi:hypothetical protein